MNFFIKHGRAAALAMALTVGAVWLAGCGGNRNASLTEKSVQGSESEKADTLTDLRDGQKYRVVKIGGKTWMAENLNHKKGNSWCYEDNDANCKQYGRLYDWNTAKTVCPAGWHLPSREEWRELVRAVDPTAQLIDNFDDANVAGTKLKAAYGWKNNGNGTDEYGFSALPGGDRYTDGSFEDAGSYGYWWAATEYKSRYAYGRSMYYDYDEGVYEGNGNDKSYGFSVRCVRN